jgi:hypothetical protein
MPTSGRAAVSSSRHSRKASQSNTEYQQYLSKREKTKSSQVYAQRPQRESIPHINTQPSATGGTQVQRPSKSRAYSAPLVPKSNPAVPEVGDSADNDASTGDEDEDEEEEEEDDEEESITNDTFFQRYDAPSSIDIANKEALNSPTTPTDPSTDTEGPLSPTSTQMRARPDSTAQPLGSPLSPRAITVSTISSIDKNQGLTMSSFQKMAHDYKKST